MSSSSAAEVQARLAVQTEEAAPRDKVENRLAKLTNFFKVELGLEYVPKSRRRKHPCQGAGARGFRVRGEVAAAASC